MRNLKRALSLGLTAAMISGLMVMGSSAASSSYTDVADTDNVEAIEVLKAVGIMIGDENGDFNPDANVTRNEMAVIMSNLMAYNVATYRDTSPFTDVPSWAEPYVAACYTNGITRGTSATTYDGDSDVTTAQAALMVMKALGYFQYQSDFGTDWQLSTVAQGNRIDLFTDVDSGVREAMTRNDVAQLVLNALEAGTVEAQTDGSLTVGDITITNNVTYKFVTSGQDYAYTINRQLDTNNDGSYSTGAIVELGEKLYQGDLTKDESEDDFGRPANIWEYQAKEIGTFAETADTLFTAKVTSKALYDAVGKTATDNYTWTVTVDGERQDYNGRDLNSNKSDDNDCFLTEANVDPATGVTGNGVITEVFVDGTHRTVHVSVIHYYSAEVYKVNADEGTITLSKFYGPDAMDTNDEFTTDQFAEDDIVMYSFANGEIQEVYAAERMTGDVSLVRVATASGQERDGDLFEADGNTYKYNYTMDSADRLVTENVNNNVVAYLDANGYVAYIDESAMTYDYAYVLSMGIGDDNYDNSTNQYTNGTVYARLVLTDGTMVKARTDLKVSDANGVDYDGITGIDLRDAIAKYNGHIVSYSVDSGNEYTLSLKDVDNQTYEADGTTIKDAGSVRGTNGTKDAPTPTALTVENGVANMTAPGHDYTVNSNTVFIVADSDTALDDYEFSVYTGVKNVPDIEGQTTGTAPNQKISAVAVAADEDYVAKVVYIQDANVSGAGNVYFAVANSNAKMDHSNTLGYYYRIDASVDGEIITLMVKENSTAAQKLVTNINEGLGLGNGKYLVALDSITYNSDGLVTNVGLYDNETGGDGYITGTGTGRSSNQTVKLTSAGRSYAWADDVVVVRYDYKGDLNVSSIGSVKDDSNDQYVAVLDSNVIIGLIVREVANGEGTTGGGAGTNTTTKDNLTIITPDTATSVTGTMSGGTVFFQFNPNIANAAEGATYSYDWTISKDGVTLDRGSESAQSLSNNLLSDSSNKTFSDTDKLTITITNVLPSAYKVTGDTNISGAPASLTRTGAGSNVSFKVTGLGSVSSAPITYTISGVALGSGETLDAGATLVNGVYTYTTTALAVSNGEVTVPATPDKLVATGAVKITAVNGDASAYSVTYNIEGADGFTLDTSSSKTSLTTAASGDSLGTLTIKMPASGVASYDYTVTVAGLNNNTISGTDAKDTGKTGDVSLNTSSPFAGTSTVYATGPVTVTVTISNVKYESSMIADNKAGANLPTSGTLAFAYDGTTITSAADVTLDTVDTVEGNFVITSVGAITKTGTLKLAVEGATLASGQTEQYLVKGTTPASNTVSFNNVKLTNVTSSVKFVLTFEEATEYNITNNYTSAGVIGESANKYQINSTGGVQVNSTDVTKAAKGETVTIKVTATNDSGTVATETISLSVNGASVSPTSAEVKNSTATATFTFTMPESAVTLTLEYTAP